MEPIIGARVIVPFRSKNVIGIIISINTIKNINIKNFKFIKRIIDNESIFNVSLLNILIWLSKYYQYPIGSIFSLILPNILSSKDIALSKNKIFLKDDINKVNKFIMNKVFFVSKKNLFKIRQILIKNFFISWLISEKNLYTKIKFYLGLFKEILKKNLQILIIVPFIKDVYRTLFFLKQYFNIPIDIIHSNLSDEIFFNVWIKTKNGQNAIVIGTKTSIFFPFLKLGLIIIYEEHNLIYKNIKKFRFNIKNIAIFRAYKENIPIILDSNTPSVKTLYNVVQKKIFWINFHKNQSYSNFQHQIVNLKKEKIRAGLSDTLINNIFENIKNNFSVLLIYNSSNFIFLGLICKHCSWVPKCNICDGYYEVNEYSNIVFCKYCLINFRKPLFCYNCNFSPLTVFNFGIRKIKKDIKKIFPNIPLLFLISLKNNIKKITHLNFLNFSIAHFGIIIATEEIVQNYYFPNVRLIGLINIDHYFFSLNFRNIEYFAQFYFNLINLIQKNSKFLTILIQTSIPNNQDLINICNKKYLFCASKILTLRKKYFLPPCSYQVILYFYSKDFKQSYTFFKFIYIFLKKQSKKDGILLWFVGPDPVFKKFKKKYFYKLLIQCSSRIYLHKILRMSLEASNYFTMFNYVKWFIEFDLI